MGVGQTDREIDIWYKYLNNYATFTIKTKTKYILHIVGFWKKTLIYSIHAHLYKTADIVNEYKYNYCTYSR